jgi:hypothetical protein
MVFGRFFHFGSDTIICLPSCQLKFVFLGPQPKSNLPHTCSVIARKPSSYLIRRRTYLAQLCPIYILSLGSHPRDGENLLVFCHTLLELTKQYTETY